MLAKARNYPLETLYSFELTRTNPLFEPDGSMKKADKSDLVGELEKFLKGDNECCDSLFNTTLIVDVMLKCRQIMWKDLQTFGKFATAFCKIIKAASKGQSDRIDFIFDSYLGNSTKFDTRSGRYKESAIEIHEIDENVTLPKQVDQFWASKRNKVLLQKFLRKFILQNSDKYWINNTVICSATNETLCQSNLETDSETFALLQRPDIEEADSRIILHIYQACREGTTNVVVLSSDTDVVVLLMYYWSTFKAMKLQVSVIRFQLINKNLFLTYEN